MAFYSSPAPPRVNTSHCCSGGGMAAVATNCDTEVSDMCCVIGVAKEASLGAPLSMFLTGICGNVLALIVLYKSRVENQRTVFYTLLAGLIWTDLFGQVTTSILPIVVHSRSVVNPSRNRTTICWIGGIGTCYVHAFLMITIGLITPCFVAFMALERVFCLKHWYFYSQTVTKQRAKFVIFGIWCFGIIFSILPLCGFGTYALQFPGTWCFLNFHANDTGSFYALIYATINCVLICLTVFCNIVVIATLLRVRKTRKALVGLDKSPFTAKRIPAEYSQSLSGQSSSTPRKLSNTVVCACVRVQKNLMKDLEIQMVVLLAAITVTFTVCWTPLMVQIFINEITGITDYKSDLRGVHMASINQILDPWVYILFRKSVLIRIARVILRCMHPNHNRPVATLGTVRATQRTGRMRRIVAQPVIVMAEQQGEEIYQLALHRVTEEKKADVEMNESTTDQPVQTETMKCACSCHQEPYSHSSDRCQVTWNSIECLRLQRQLAMTSTSSESDGGAIGRMGCWPSFTGSIYRKPGARRTVSFPRTHVSRRPLVRRQRSAPNKFETTNAHIHSVSVDSGISDNKQ